jgi:hypothetical protein
MTRTWRTLGPKKSTRKVIAMDRSPYKTAITFKQKAVCRSVNAVKENLIFELVMQDTNYTISNRDYESF